MARFNFRLQQYLGIKEQIEEQKELEYAKALRKVQEERELLERLIDMRLNEIEMLKKQINRRIEPITIRRHNNTIEKLKHNIIAQRERLAAAEAFAEKKRLELIEAMKERKTIERVRENALEVYKEEEKAQEFKQIDELVSFKYASI